jgi:hypothetical protein
MLTLARPVPTRGYTATHLSLASLAGFFIHSNRSGPSHMTNKRSPSSTRRPGRQSPAALRNGLLEIAPQGERQVFWGTLRQTADRVLLEQAHGGNVSIACFGAGNPHALDRQAVSVVGHQAEPEGGDPHIIAERIVSHAAVAVRAYELHQLAPCSSPFENWLRAEHELLGL